MSLAEAFRKHVSRFKDPRLKEEKVPEVGYPTGYLGIDFLNGAYIHVSPDGGDTFFYPSIGLVDGSYIQLIGRSGAGKSTLAIQIAANIVRPFPDAVVFEDQTEAGTMESRKDSITGFYGMELKKRFITRDNGITSENVYQRIKIIHDEKINNPDKYLYNTGFLDTMGNPIHKFVPTVYIVDSIAMLVPDNQADEDELSGQMGASAIAKTNTAVFKKILSKLKAANIILIGVNHILDDIQMGYVKKQTQLRYLKEGERLPGGKIVNYSATNVLRLDDSKGKADDKYGLSGAATIKLSMVKSRTNISGTSIPMILDSNGFDSELSLLEYLDEHELIDHRASKYWLKMNPDVTFTRKDFKNMMATNPEFKQMFTQASFDALLPLIKEPISQYDDTMDCITNDILGMLGKIRK